MHLVLHPRAAPAGVVRVWVGVFETASAPALGWRLGEQPMQPTALRPLQSARTGPLLDDATAKRAFTGVYEFSGAGIAAGSNVDVVCMADGSPPARLSVRTLPAGLPEFGEPPFNVMLVSCFHRDEDRQGFAGTTAGALPATYSPHLSVLMGDQVYLDLPTARNFPGRAEWLAAKFERDYTDNWRRGSGYSAILSAAPSTSLPDDHEYWNNFPHRSPIIENSWSAAGRTAWTAAAQAMYTAFQRPEPEAYTRCLELDVDPLSFFFLDTRTHRKRDRSESTPTPYRLQLATWAQRVIADERVAVVATGQSLLDEKRGRIGGGISDYTLPNYGDYSEIMNTLASIMTAGLPLLLLTGDVHWGRLIRARHPVHLRPLLYEVIASPTSLVTTIGRDNIVNARDAVARVFGRGSDWPRHAEPGRPPAYFGEKTIEYPLPIDKPLLRQRGDHFATIGFARRGSGVTAEVVYWPIRRDGSPVRPDARRVIDLLPA